MANTYRIKRGVVFWCNLDERINKNSNPTVLVDKKEYPDHRQYGMRHWLVVSNDMGNLSSPTCTVVPITGATSKTSIPAHATVTFRGRKFDVLCEQIMTVNIVSLKEYAYTLSEHDMRNVDKALAVQCALTSVQNSSEIENRLLQMEQRMEKLLCLYENSLNKIIADYEKRLAELSKNDDGNQKVLCEEPDRDKTVKKGEDLSSKEFSHPSHPVGNDADVKSGSQAPVHKHLTQIEKINVRYLGGIPETKSAPVVPSASVTTPSVSSDKRTGTKKHKWTKEMMQEYLDDTATLPPMRTAEKWGLKDIRTVYSMKYYVQNRLKCFAEAN